MSDAQRPPDDELVSAYLDGEATPHERAVVEADPELLRQVEVFRQVNEQTRSVAPATDAVRERNIAAALAVFDAEVAPSTGVPHGAVPTPSAPVAPVGLAAPPVGPDRPGVVTDFDAARQRREARSMRVLGVAAAIVVVVLIAAGLLVRGRSTTNDVAANLPTAATQEQQTKGAANEADVTDRAPATARRGAEADRGAASPQNPNAAVTTTAPVRPAPTTTPSAPTAAAGGESSPASDSANAISGTYVGDLEAITAGPNFRAVIAERLDRIDSERAAGRTPTTSPIAAPTSGQLASCNPKLLDRDDELGDLVLTAKATVDGKPALVLAYEVDPAVTNANGAFRAFAVTTDCTVLDTQTV